MKYPAYFEAAPKGGYTVAFRDIPEAITEGDTIEDGARHGGRCIADGHGFLF